MMSINKTLKYGYFVFALAAILETSLVQASEIEERQREDRRLRVELDLVPTQPQHDFEQYVQELAASAQREAKEPNSKREPDAAKEKHLKTLNPMVLFRW